MLIEVILILLLDLGGQSEVLLPSECYAPGSNKHLVMHTDWCSRFISRPGLFPPAVRWQLTPDFQFTDTV